MIARIAVLINTNPSPISKLNYPCSNLRNMSNFSTDLWSILAPEVWPTHDKRPECVYYHCKGELTIFWLRAVHLPQG